MNQTELQQSNLTTSVVPYKHRRQNEHRHHKYTEIQGILEQIGMFEY